MTPIRIQRKRTTGWRMPLNTIYVGRGSRWGNPFPTHEPERDGHGDIIKGRKIQVRTAREAVKLYRHHLMPYNHIPPHNTVADFLQSVATIEEIEIALRGSNLACWCDLDKPCHADFLLTLANGVEDRRLWTTAWGYEPLPCNHAPEHHGRSSMAPRSLPEPAIK